MTTQPDALHVEEPTIVKAWRKYGLETDGISYIDALLAANRELTQEVAQRGKTVDAMIERAMRAEDRALAAIAALQRIVDGIPACGSDGSLYIEHHDGEGNPTGTEHVDPLSVIQSIEGTARAAIDAAAE